MNGTSYFVICQNCFNECEELLKFYDKSTRLNNKNDELYCDFCYNAIDDDCHIIPNNEDTMICALLQFIRSNLITELNTRDDFNNQFKEYILSELISIVGGNSV